MTASSWCPRCEHFNFVIAMKPLRFWFLIGLLATPTASVFAERAALSDSEFKLLQGQVEADLHSFRRSGEQSFVAPKSRVGHVGCDQCCGSGPSHGSLCDPGYA